MQPSQSRVHAEPDKTVRKREPAREEPETMLGYLQRTAGNQAVSALLQRVGADGDGSDPDAALAEVSGTQQLDLPVPEPMTEPLNYGPGDYELPKDNGTAMAKHDLTLQRDDAGQPPNQFSGQGGVTLKGPQQAPFQLQVTRTLHLIPPLTLDKLHLDFFGDSQIAIAVDSGGTFSAQVAQNLLTLHLFPTWRVPVDTTLAAIYNQNILPKLVSQPGGQVQTEAHVTKTFSLTFTVQGVRTDSADGNSRVWSVTAAGGFIKYF